MIEGLSKDEPPRKKGEIPLYHRSGDKPLDPTTLPRKVVAQRPMSLQRRIDPMDVCSLFVFFSVGFAGFIPLKV